MPPLPDEEILMEKVKLNNGVEMPKLGFGVVQVSCKKAIHIPEPKSGSYFLHRETARVKWFGERKIND